MRSTQLVALCTISFLSVGAEGRRLTRGDAEAVLHTLGTGGVTVRAHGGQGAPSLFGFPLTIRPFFADGLHYCALDWHVPSVGWVEYAFAPPATNECRQCLEEFYVDPVYYTRADAIASFSRIDNAFTLDGEPFDSIRTPLKPWLNRANIDGFVADAHDECGCDYVVTDAFIMQWGEVIGPSDLGVGEHVFSDVFTNGASSDTFSTSFFVDGSGAAACTE